jgi:hypothetical protein
VTLENQSNSTIRVYNCGPIAERELSPGRWEIAIEHYCALASATGLEVPPHGTLALTEVVSGVPSGSGGIAGRYRLLYRYLGVEEAGQMSEARSAAFEVVE